MCPQLLKGKTKYQWKTRFASQNQREFQCGESWLVSCSGCSQGYWPGDNQSLIEQVWSHKESALLVSAELLIRAFRNHKVSRNEKLCTQAMTRSLTLSCKLINKVFWQCSWRGHNKQLRFVLVSHRLWRRSSDVFLKKDKCIKLSLFFIP